MKIISRLLRYIGKKLLWLGFIAVSLSILLVASLNFINPPLWSWKLQRQISPPKNYPAHIQQQWLAWPKIADTMKLAVIAAEDQLFIQHPGFDFNAIKQAVNSNAQGKRLRGASTITQQTAKNLFLWAGKSYIRKGIEVWFTALLELILSKQRILELYLNLVEFGPGIFGVEAASQHFYHKSAENLTIREAARLAAVLPNPYRFHVNRPTDTVRQKTAWIEKQMRQLGQGAIPSG